MKKNLDYNKITLTVNGRKESFSKEELIAKLERLAELEKIFSKKHDAEVKTFELFEKPTEGKCFKVDPIEIVKKEILFLQPRIDKKQDIARRRILKAINEVKKNPYKYGEVFYLLIPKKEWVYRGKTHKTIEEQNMFAESLGGFTSNWVTEPLVWAQRIINGESWETLCNEPDTLKWYRIVIWENSEAKLVGGASEINDYGSASAIRSYIYYSKGRLNGAVPSIILKSLENLM